MSQLDDAINGLSSDELDTLNGDPQMLADFKAKYSQPVAHPTPQTSPITNTLKSIGTAVSPELSTAVEAFNSPIGQKLQDLSAVPYQGLRGLATGVAQAVPALRSGDASQLPTLQEALQRASEATQPGYKPQTPAEKAADIGSQIIEPRSLLASKVVEAAGPVLKKSASELGKQVSKLQEVLTAVDDNNFRELFNNPAKILTAPSSKETGPAFQAAKNAAGLTVEDERAIATKEDFRKSIYNDTMQKVDAYLKAKQSTQTAEQAGREFLGPKMEQPELTTGGAGTDELAPIRPPKVEVYSKGIQKDVQGNSHNIWNVKGDPNEVAKFGFGTDPASIPEDTLIKHGLLSPEGKPITPPEPLTVADLLKAKKAGQLMAQSDPSTRGFFTDEIHTKINPVLKEMAPAVYDAQQAVHLSKVKESLLNLFPQGKGMMNYFRTISMLGGSLFHGIGMLESPLVQTGLTLGARGATEVLSSPLAKVGAGAAINRIGQNEMNRRALQSVGDRLKNYRDTEYANK